MGSQAIRYLILPGWQGSPADHWQSNWQHSLPAASRVEQLDWDNPDPHEWVASLDQRLAEVSTPTILIAHSLGCITVARWAAQANGHALQRVRGALLVAPADVERPGCPQALRSFAPIPLQSLPFPTRVVGSDTDPAASVPRVLELAQQWGSEVAILPGAGHINVKSGFSHWEQGFAYLFRLQSQIEQHAKRRA